MDKNLACHEIAMETARAYISSNMPEYVNISDSKGYAKDMAEKYYEAYREAKKVFDEKTPKAHARVLK